MKGRRGVNSPGMEMGVRQKLGSDFSHCWAGLSDENNVKEDLLLALDLRQHSLL